MRRFWILLLAAFFLALPVLAQDDEAEQTDDTEEVEESQVEESQVEENDFDETNLDDQGFTDVDDDFRPSEDISTDQSISFPTDI